MANFWGELRRRKVVRVAIAYAIGAWVLLQIGDTLFGLLNLPDWAGPLLVGGVVVGFPVALILSWMYDWTPSGFVSSDNQPTTDSPSFEFSEPENINVGELHLVQPALGELIGRREEVKTLRTYLQAAKDGEGGIVMIGGEPGVGKSRLGEEALALGLDMGLLPLTGHAYEDRGAPYVTCIEMLEEILHVLPDKNLRDALGNTAPEIAMLLPELRRKFPGIPESTELPPEQQQRFLFSSLLEFLTRLGQGCPLVLLMDDMHWADESSTQLLEYLAPHVQRLPILVVLTYRDVQADMGDAFKRVLASLTRQAHVRQIALRGFSVEDVRSLLNTLSGHKPPNSVVDTIFQETDGNAFYVQSVYEHLSDEGQLFSQSGEWLTDIEPAVLDVPQSVRLVTGRRIEKLRDSTQNLLKIAAVTGLRFSLSVLEVVDEESNDTIGSVEEAERAHLIKRSTGEPELRYEFVHALARQTVLSELSEPRRQQLHLRIAQAIEATHASSSDRHAAKLAFHFSEAGGYAEPDKVVRWLKRAGEQAKDTAAADEAVGYFSHALTLTGDADTPARAELLRLRGAAQLSLGKVTEVQEDMSVAFSLYQQLGLLDRATQVAADLAHVFIWSAQPSKAHELAQRGLALVPDESSVQRCNLLSMTALAHSYDRKPGDATAGKDLHEQAVGIARNLGDQRLLAEMLQNQAMDCWVRLDRRGSEIAHEAAGIVRAADQRWKLGHCLWVEKTGLVFAGKFEDAARIDDELLSLADRNGDFGSLGCAWLMTTTIELSRGNLDAASQALQHSEKWFEAGSFPWGRFNAGYDAIIQLLKGNAEEARAAVDKVAEKFVEGIVWTGSQHGYWLSAKAQLGDVDIIQQYNKLRYNLPEPDGEMAAGAVVFLKGAIEALVVCGENEEAAKLYALINEFIERDLGCCEFSFGIHDRFAGMAAWAAEDWSNAERHYNKALELADTLPHRADQATVRYWYARMLIDRGRSDDEEKSRELVSTAHKLAAGMNMDGLIERLSVL